MSDTAQGFDRSVGSPAAVVDVSRRAGSGGRRVRVVAGAGRRVSTPLITR